MCASPADDYSHDIPAHSAVCLVSPDGLLLSDVVVTGCAIERVSFEPVPVERAVGVTVAVSVAFSFTGTIDGFIFTGQGSCEQEVFFEDLILPRQTRLTTPVDCEANFVCSARYAGPNAAGSQQFIIHVSGSITCVGCSTTPYVIVQGCPTSSAVSDG